MNKKKLKTKWWSEPGRRVWKSFCHLPNTICYLLFTIILLSISTETRGQTIPIGEPIETYIRMLQYDFTPDSISSFNIRPVSAFENRKSHTENRISSHPWESHPLFNPEPLHYKAGPLSFSAFTPSIFRGYNSDFALGQNDGALWQGEGINYAFSLGGLMEYGPLKVIFRPEFGHISNAEFELSPYRQWPFDISGYGMPLSRIDNPQRFGEDPFFWFHPGQSSVSLNRWGWSAGISTANIWTGPAMLNPLILSNNAPGFFHGFIGTEKPFSTPAGNIEARIFWGGLQESDYFDDNEENNLRYINGIVFNYSPSFVPGLHVGFQRIFYEYYPENGLRFSDLLRFAQPFTEENFASMQEVEGYNISFNRDFLGDDSVHMLSFFGRYAVPGTGFETYFEWGRNDHSWDWRKFLTERVHTRSYVLGFLKRFSLQEGRRWITMNFEMTQLENLENLTQQNSHPSWYEHIVVRQGFTNQGQIMGAAIGPGSNSQFLGINFYDKLGMAGLSVNRIIYQNDRLYRHFHIYDSYQLRHLQENKEEGEFFSPRKIYEVEFRYGLHALVFLPYNFEIQADLYRSNIMNRYNLIRNDVTNTNAQVTLRYNLPGFLR